MSEIEKLRTALLQAWCEMHNDYVDDVWGRDLSYIADALGVAETELRKSYESRMPFGDDAWIAEWAKRGNRAELD